VDALATENSGIEGHAVAPVETIHLCADARDDARGILSLEEPGDATARGAIVTMDVGTADPAGADLNQDVVRTADRIGHVHVGHLFIFREEQGFHRSEEGGFWREGKTWEGWIDGR
jgi:hypothetical protein